MSSSPRAVQLSSSFRDPSGFLFSINGTLYRQVNRTYKEHYDLLMSSGLYDALVEKCLLIPHTETNTELALSGDAYKIIQPELLPFISYPYEWCFSQLKDAAMATLEIQKTAFQYGMSLKDCSAYNIQFKNAKPVFIDTLSFEKYPEGRPWVAYRQYCQHFLAPLALMSHTDIRMNSLLRLYIDGLPLDLVSSNLPFKTRLNFSMLSHLHMHAKSQTRFAAKPAKYRDRKMSRMGFQGVISSLESAVKKMKLKNQITEWAEYYSDTNYSNEAFQHKKDLVLKFLEEIKPNSVWDLGGNVGVFSRIASEQGIHTVCFDIDPSAVENHYLECHRNNYKSILPLVMDLTNPSPGIGWNNTERMSLKERGPADTALAFALIHHLAISNNLPFIKIAEYFSMVCKSLIIEFVPKNDSQVQRLLASREDIFNKYNQKHFEADFKAYFSIEKSVNIMDSNRVFYLMKRKSL